MAMCGFAGTGGFAFCASAPLVAKSKANPTSVLILFSLRPQPDLDHAVDDSTPGLPVGLRPGALAESADSFSGAGRVQTQPAAMTHW